MSKSRTIASNLGTTSGAGGGVTAYDSAGLLPTSGNTVGDFGWATNKKALYTWDGAEWDRVYSGPNETLTWDSALPSNISLSQLGTNSVITFKANPDFEGFPITYSYQTVPSYPLQLDSAYGEDSASGGTGILDSSDHPTNPRLTLKPSSNSNDGGNFTLRVKATDGTHVISSSSTVSLTFSEGDYWYIANSGYNATIDRTSGVSTYQGSSVTLATVGGVEGHIGGSSQNGAGTGLNGAMVWDLSTTGGFDATTDLIVMSFYIPDFSGVTLGIGIRDNVANEGIMFSGYSGNFGIVKSAGSFFDIPALPAATWIIMAAGGGNSITSPSGTPASSGLRFWPANTSGGSTLNTEYSAAAGAGAGFAAQTLDVPGIIAFNGGDAGTYTSGYERNALEYYLRSVQVYYDQTTSGRTIEQIVGTHQEQAFG